MSTPWSIRWATRIGAVLVALGLGFAADRHAPFVRVGALLGVVGLVCLLLPGWVDFGRKSRW